MCSRPPVPREPLRRVAVTGGTHGNEMSGIYLARYWLQAPRELQRPSFSAVPVLANPAATAACRRYLGRDLNRTFTSTFLTARAHPDDPYEVTRARELNQLLGPKASGRAFDFILDLHNTTANMGTCLIAESAHNVFAMHLCRYLQLQSSELPCHVFLYQSPGEESYCVDSVAKNGMGLELGPQPQGVLRADLFIRMRALVAAALDFIQLFNQGTDFPAFEMEAYRTVSHVDFPRTEAGDLAGTVHPQLQDRDFEPLRPGAPIFQTFSGEDVLYEEESTVYPVFINEAAYYEKGIAFLQTEKLNFSVPTLPALAPTPTPTP
ncbi:N-acyl-aromatic-L-amino acid amidohydrolase (carboxylate-forming) isoform X2 [Saccopteryx bilineata]